MHPNTGPLALLFNQPRLAMIDRTKLQVIPTPSVGVEMTCSCDGHCFVHLLRVSTETYLRWVLPHEEILRLLKNEIVINEDVYTSLLSALIDGFCQQARCYFENKYFITDFGDLLPIICTNMLNLQIIITYTPKLQLRDCHIVSSSMTRILTEILYIVLHLSRQHYSGTAFNANFITIISYQKSYSPSVLVQSTNRPTISKVTANIFNTSSSQVQSLTHSVSTSFASTSSMSTLVLSYGSNVRKA